MPTPGITTKAECAVSSITGTGSGLAITLLNSGNVLNFSINSVAYYKCTVVAWDTIGGGIGWTIDFGAKMGATASTTVIIGSPTWTKTFDTGSAPMAISNPTAGTTFGGISITGTPTAVKATYGGKCTMTKSTRVLACDFAPPYVLTIDIRALTALPLHIMNFPNSPKIGAPVFMANSLAACVTPPQPI